MPSSGLQLRTFLTCWIVFCLFYATDFVREHFLVHSMVDSGTFSLDPYDGMHPDIFRNPPNAPHGGTHHGANPGISMVAAVPYALAKPLVDFVVARELASRDPAAEAKATYNDPREKRIAFYRRARELGVDVRFGLIGLVTMVFCMAPLSALSVVVMLRLLLGFGFSTRQAFWCAMAYAVATPMLFRTAFLNQNIAIGIFSIFALGVLREARDPARAPWRVALAGFLGGLCLLSDYSGGLTLALFGLYACWLAFEREAWTGAVRTGVVYTLGAVPPILLLGFYQWQSFGNAFYPPQHWMPPVEWIEVGYQGVGGPQLDLFWYLLAEPRYGLFVFGPLLLLAFAWPWYARRRQTLVPGREALLAVALTLAYLVFFSAVQYTRLQWVTGIRYVMPVVPFLFLLVADVLRLVPRVVALPAVAAGVIVNLVFAMTRGQAGFVAAVERIVREGPMLPSTSTLSRMTVQYLPVSPGQLELLMVLATALLVTLVWWAPGRRRAATTG